LPLEVSLVPVLRLRPRRRLVLRRVLLPLILPILLAGVTAFVVRLRVTRRRRGPLPAFVMLLTLGPISRNKKERHRRGNSRGAHRSRVGRS